MATANTIRFAGADRYQTNLALSLALRGSGGFPFDTSDRTEGGVARLAQAKQWWGAASCPRSIIVVAGDAVADSLAAASLSDPTDRSDQPRLQRVAAADPLFDPPGGFARVDNAYAPIVVTTSTRSGATSLAPTARLTASDLAKGGCALARQAIIVGGSAAVPTGVESELVSLGYDSVFRVAGTDRYDTAARVATALGTGTPPPAGTQCVDATTSDGEVTTGYYGNAVIEYRSAADTCGLRSRSVVLADGVAGIDALAAGWWTSYWQVPVLLTGPGGSLPPATRVALQTLNIDTIVVLGGPARIPKATMDQAGQLAGATPGRFDGSDRYDTSVEMARQFGGWYPAPGATFGNDVLCVTASSGPSGSPDALAAGPFCSRLGAARVASPARAEPPVEGDAAQHLTVGGVAGGHSAVPVLLVPPGGNLPASVTSFLAAAFAAPRCTGDAAPSGCAQPGFATVVGGGVGPSAVAQLGQLLADRDLGEHTPVAGGFATRLDLRPVFAASTPSTSPQVCYGSDTLANIRWLSLSTDVTRRTFLGQRDVLRDGWYKGGASAPNCMVLPKLSPITVTGVGVAGQVSVPLSYDLAASAALSVTRPIQQSGTAVGPTSASSWTFDQAPDEEVNLVRGGVFRAVQRATLGLDLTSRPGAPGVGVVAGRVTLTTAFGEISGTIRADGRQVGGAWELAGVVELGPFADGRLRGGFRATISTTDGPSARISWAVDGVPTS
ncbi:MAG: hypothetical protein JWM05_2702 [Acidimicrobiales bacterium]|nr:hypothetical protein [Acidimicrobiales bacterium]